MSVEATAAGEARLGDEGVELPVADRWVQRRVTLIWCLLFLDVLPFYYGGQLLVPIPKSIGQLVTAGALVGALLLSLSLNRRMELRPNVVLCLATLLACTALAASMLGASGFGSVVRAIRLFGFLIVLWLLTPWWGRRDLLLVRSHLRALVLACSTVVVGLVFKPSVAMNGSGQHRLTGILWPMPPAQVAEYSALMAGLAIVLWLCGQLAKTPALLLAGGGIALVIATKTRTAVIALAAGVVCAALTLFLTKVRVRRTVAVILIVLPIAAIALFPVFSLWFNRHQSTTERAGLTGRKQKWDALLAAPRPEFNRWFGYGLSDKSFNGLAIDSTWLAVYQDQGLIGDAAVGVTLAILLIAPFYRRPGAARAVAVFLVVYVAVASYTEVGLGDASPYVLTIVAAASMVTPGRRRRQVALE